MTVFAQNKLMFFGHFGDVLPVFEGKVDNPASDEEADEEEEESCDEIGNIPSGACVEVSQLPETKEYE